jgi:hypothetical protein
VAHAGFSEDAVAGDPVKCLGAGFPPAQAADGASMVLFAGIRYHLITRVKQLEREPDGELAAAKEFRDPCGVGWQGRGLVVLE